MHTSTPLHFFSMLLLIGRYKVAPFIVGLLYFVGSLPAQAQCTETISNNGNRTYSTSGPNQTICVSTTGFSRTIIINHSGCTLNINSGASIDAQATLTFNSGATSLTINNNGNIDAAIGTFRGGAINNTGTWNSDIDAVTAATTISNNGTWIAARRFNGIAAPLTLTNASGRTWATTINTGAGSSLNITNSGTWNVGLSMSPGTNQFTNTATGTATFLTLGFGGTSTQITNQGTMSLTASRVDVQSSATITNASGATLNTNALSINLTATLNNAGTIQATNFYNDQGTTTNTGVLRTSVDFFNYSGTVTNTNRVIVAGGFTNNGTFAGPVAPSRGSVTVAGNSNNTGSFGVVGRLDFCDAGRPTGFDTQNGAVGAATTFCSTTPLPVTLVYFKALRQGNGVAVSWNTASELQNAYFVVERSAEGKQFDALQEVAGQGTSAQTTHYQFLDAHPLPHTAYYRLWQVDIDGSRSYSSVVTVAASERAEIQLAPNPAHTQVLISGVEPGPVQLLDMTGRVVPTAPVQQSVLPLAGVKPGMYMLRTSSGTRRLMVE